MTATPSTLLELDRHWSERALCQDASPTDFFPDDDDPREKAAAVARARRYCAQCPVRRPCLAKVLLLEGHVFSIRGEGEEPVVIRHVPDGVWGGTTLEQRKRTRNIRDLDARIAHLDAEFKDIAVYGKHPVIVWTEWKDLE